VAELIPGLFRKLSAAIFEREKMKYFKLILVIVITASVAGSVVWHLMWMTGIKKRFKEEQSSGVINIVGDKEGSREGQKGKTETNRPVGDEGAISTKEMQTQINQTEATQAQKKMQGDNKAESGTKPAEEETKPDSLKDDGKWFERDIGLGKRGPKVKPVTGQTTTGISNDKRMSVTIQNKANTVMQKNIPLPQPMQRPEVKVTGVTQHPTSTAPK